MRPICVGLRPALLLASLALASTALHGGRGAAELTLDRGSVAGLIEAALPPPLQLDVPGLGRQSIALGAPREVEFREGGIELFLPLRIGQTREPARLEIRLEPEIDRAFGGIELRPVRLELVGIPSLPLDLAAWVGPVKLPRRIEWSLPLADGEAMQIVGFVQGLRVLEDRLELTLSLATEPSPANGRSR